MSRYFSFTGKDSHEKLNILKTVSTFLSNKNYSVAIIKRMEGNNKINAISSNEIIHQEEFPSIFKAYLSSKGEQAVIFNENTEAQIFQWAEDIADYILLDNFYNLPDIPNAIILNGEEPNTRMNKDTIAINGTHEKSREHPLYKSEVEFPGLVEKFALPPNRELNCGKCGYPNCKAFRTMVLKSKAVVSDCVTNKSPVQLCVNGTDIALVPFTQKLIESIIKGMIQPLHIPDKEIETIQISIKKK